ncbi:DUF3667 domain-containing protein [Penaeicola halotolerans]|uniref:DUF3667 domain-containing protein n=1 Tax=Penaeicola halotolerans TaxID=2793196 RepID=UPI001CF8DFA6|nr:DUF3667 domain-containing protein [Penaeicola halotolerans]
MEEKATKYPLVHQEEKLIERITFGKFLRDVLAVFNLEKGYLATLKNLIIQPGALIRAYFEASRFKQFHPLRLLLINTTLALLICNYFDIGEGMAKYSFGQLTSGGVNSIEGIDFSESRISDFFYRWYNLMNWLYIPVGALVAFLVYRKKGFNLAEHFVISTFINAMIQFFQIVVIFVPVIWGFEIYSFVAFILMLTYYTWVYNSFFKEKLMVSFLKTLLIVLGSSFAYTIIYYFILGIYMTT